MKTKTSLKNIFSVKILIALLTTMGIVLIADVSQAIFGDNDGDGCGDLDITCNPNIKKGSRKIAEEAWGEAGRAFYVIGAQTTRRRNPRAQSLSRFTSEPTHNKFLRQRYGSLVGKTRVIYGATLLDEWCAAGKCLDLPSESVGQAFCDTIYIRDPYIPNDSSQLLLLVHEFRHIQQCKDVGGKSNFGYRYFKEYYRAGEKYENNSMEIEANNAERDFLNNIFCPQIECPGYRTDSWVSFGKTVPNSYFFSGPALPRYHAKMPMFDPRWYLQNNSDVNDACKGNHTCAKDHYLKAGLKECRNASPKFNPRWYLENNPDVLEVFKDCRGASEHWSGAGRSEGRSGAP